jgi:hypothetical protein
MLKWHFSLQTLLKLKTKLFSLYKSFVTRLRNLSLFSTLKTNKKNFLKQHIIFQCIKAVSRGPYLLFSLIIFLNISVYVVKVIKSLFSDHIHKTIRYKYVHQVKKRRYFWFLPPPPPYIVNLIYNQDWHMCLFFSDVKSWSISRRWMCLLTLKMKNVRPRFQSLEKTKQTFSEI